MPEDPNERMCSAEARCAALVQIAQAKDAGLARARVDAQSLRAPITCLELRSSHCHGSGKSETSGRCNIYGLAPAATHPKGDGRGAIGLECRISTESPLKGCASVMQMMKNGGCLKVFVRRPSLPSRSLAIALSIALAGCAAAQHNAPAKGTGTIHIVAATYGRNCGIAHGNVTAPLRKACEEQADCDYSVNYQILGDPAVGCAKDFIVEWQCGIDAEIQQQLLPPEAGYGSRVGLHCEGVRPKVAGAGRGKGVRVVSATYGGTCNVRAGNVTGQLAQSCNGHTTCDYSVDYHVLGDPSPGCAKDFVVEWACETDGTTHRRSLPGEAGFGSKVMLTCAAGSSARLPCER